MGFEVTFEYFEKLDDGEYNRDDPKTKTINIGEPLDDVPVERLAATIMREFAYDIWIEDVNIFEYVKKPLAYKEAKGGGIIIGNKKYNLGLNEIMKWAVQEDKPKVEAVAPAPQPAPQPAPAPPQPPPPPQMQHPQYSQYPQQQPPMPQWREDQQPRRTAPVQYAAREEVLDPPPELAHDLNGLPLTVGKKYQILRESAGGSSLGSGFVYVIRDDTGKEQAIRSHYFRPVQNGLVVTTSYVDQQGHLRDTTRLGDYDMPNRGPQPRLTYDNQPGLNYSESVAEPAIDNMLQKMDAALSRRRRT